MSLNKMTQAPSRMHRSHGLHKLCRKNPCLVALQAQDLGRFMRHHRSCLLDHGSLLGSNQSLTNGQSCQFDTIVYPQLVHDAVPMTVHRLDR
ncbi:MAG: hypothetical protein KatS3mg114_0361 [Planctomycetaceae bacterium]|nr:MAG: hypothetical protein KatS3mg114_0361 [Planctomycetaceae bacterium]